VREEWGLRDSRPATLQGERRHGNRVIQTHTPPLFSLTRSPASLSPSVSPLRLPSSVLSPNLPPIHFLYRPHSPLLSDSHITSLPRSLFPTHSLTYPFTYLARSLTPTHPPTHQTNCLSTALPSHHPLFSSPAFTLSNTDPVFRYDCRHCRPTCRAPAREVAPLRRSVHAPPRVTRGGHAPPHAHARSSHRPAPPPRVISLLGLRGLQPRILLRRHRCACVRGGEGGG
jgi:hypothetical protein